MYKVVKHFYDLQDVKRTKSGDLPYEYNVGDAFPRNGKKVSDERIKELAGSDNKQGTPLIEEVEEKKPEKKAAKKAGAKKSAAK